MARGPLYQHGYEPQFSGHETFPLRYGWLKKAFDRVAETETNPITGLPVGTMTLSRDSASARIWSRPFAIGRKPPA